MWEPWLAAVNTFDNTKTCDFPGNNVTFGWIVTFPPVVVVAVIFVISIGYPTEFCTDNDKPPLFVNIAEDTGVLEKPVIVVDMLDDGLKIPIE